VRPSCKQPDIVEGTYTPWYLPSPKEAYVQDMLAKKREEAEKAKAGKHTTTDNELFV